MLPCKYEFQWYGMLAQANGKQSRSKCRCEGLWEVGDGFLEVRRESGISSPVIPEREVPSCPPFFMK